MDETQYARLEIERRWLVNDAMLPKLAALPFKQLIDLYIDESRLRLRKELSEGVARYKLCKKYGKQSGLSEAITNIYLSEAEYLLLSQLPGKIVSRKRYYYSHHQVEMSINIGEKLPTILEAEFPNEEDARSFAPPDFAGTEITADTRYQMAMLVQ